MFTNGFKNTLALVTLTVALASTPIYGQQAGALDPTFGTGGRVTTDFGASSDGASSIALQTDGKLVVAGGTTINGSSNFALARYNSNGTLDGGFGNAGKVITDFGGPFESATAIAVQPDGKILAAGGTVIGDFNNFALARYNSNGTLDATFGAGGKVIIGFGEASAQAYSVVVQADGKIVVGGQVNIDGGYDFAIVRCNHDGTLDASFGAGGKVVTDFGMLEQDFSFAQAFSVAVQLDGKIVVAGKAFIDGRYVFALARYNSTGTLDYSFGTGGKATTIFLARNTGAFSVAVQPDGKIVAAGFTGADVALVRYTPWGALDTGFGASGRVTTDIAGSSDTAFAITLQRDGKIVAVGRTFIDGNFHSALLRYDTWGALDASFGTGGKLTTIFGALSEGVSSVIVQPDGRIVVAGGIAGNGGGDFAIARFQ